MKRPISIHQTFEAIRQMPLEVSFDQVKVWVENASVLPGPRAHWLKNLFQKLKQNRYLN